MKSYIYQDQLESERLTTRFLTNDDIEIWTNFFEDKEAIQHFPNFEGNNSLRSKLWIERQLNRYNENKYGLQVLIEKGTSNFIGQCGLLSQEVDGIEELEVGYHIFQKYWGKGFAPEAAKLFIDYAFKNKLSDSIISIINTKNIKSQRVAEKNGLIRDKQTKWLEMDVYIYRINKK